MNKDVQANLNQEIMRRDGNIRVIDDKSEVLSVTPGHNEECRKDQYLGHNISFIIHHVISNPK
jgi:hypothetical protein